ncbi:MULTISPECIES: FecCD family ABC transporter permease [Halobacillus]|uniref:FecCD family ABC transporter permease n=1 Tax=Halobacillus TaxID=45667 RepID=UPI00136CE98B|nr:MULTISPECIES: iron ABC transporter permease [Halobacillus]MYL31636.1 iron chelate uptake ABC transporter family permease subunit [Halobacillus halophilus]MYL39981.1 iron chelate uptake ABC transporter family permease subunit [Halobacillus litoralis]
MNKLSTNRSFQWYILFAFLLLFFTAAALSILVGKTPIPLSTAWDAFFHYDTSDTNHIIIRTSRLTRTLIAITIGASLSIAGALMQALTRNPLAAPDIFGVNAGALFFIVTSATFFSVESLSGYMWIGFLGAGVAGAIVYLLGSMGEDGLSPIRIVLAGAAISALFISFTQGMLVMDEQRMQSVLFWLAGSVAGRELGILLPVLPFIGAAIILSLWIGKPLNILMSGDDVAKNLGQNTGLVKLIIGVIVVFLAGGSVAVAGSVGFIGLVVPHIVKGFTGPNYQWILPMSGVFGATLLLFADIAARLIIAPQEMPIGVMTALFGTPFFIYIARKGVKKSG